LKIAGTIAVHAAGLKAELQMAALRCLNELELF